MHDMPSEEQLEHIWNAMRQLVPDFQQSVQRYRIDMVAALSPDHRDAVGKALGRYAVTEKQNREDLMREVAAIVTPEEQEKILVALAAYVNDQQTMSAKAMQSILQEHPELLREANQPAEIGIQRTPARGAADAVRVLTNWLVLQAIEDNGSEEARLSILTAFNYSGTNNTQIRARLRQSILDALLPNQRARVAQAIAEAAVSTATNDAALAETLTRLLSADERQTILDAFEAFVSEQIQEQKFWRSRLLRLPRAASMANHFPDLEALARQVKVSNPGAVLWRALLNPGMTATVSFSDKGPSAEPRIEAEP